MDHSVGVQSKNSPLKCWIPKISSCFFPKSFIILHFTVKSVIHFASVFVQGVSLGWDSFFFFWTCPFAPAPFVEKAVLSPPTSCWPSAAVCVRVCFWALWSVWPVCLSLHLGHTVLISVSTQSALVLGRVILIYSSLPGLLLSILGPAPFHINFKISLSVSTKALLGFW